MRVKIVRRIAAVAVCILLAALSVAFAACSGDETSDTQVPAQSGQQDDGQESVYYECVFVDGVTDEEITSVSVSAGGGADAPEAPVHEHYSFSGWYCDGKRVTFPFVPSENCAVVAEYEILVYSYEFIADDETVSYGKADALTEITAPDPPERDHAEFVGWAIGGEIAEFPYVLTGDAEFTASYTNRIYEYSFVSCEKVVASGSADALTEIEAPTAEREHYEFVGWATDDKIAEFPFELVGDVTFTAVFEPITYKITYDLGGGYNYPYNPDEYDVTQNVIVLGNPTALCREFLFWTVNGDKTENGVLPASGGDLTVCAVWSEPKHTFGNDHVCSVCGHAADRTHVYRGSHVCSVCGYEEADHEYDGGVCVMCGYVCAHEDYGEDHRCAECGEEASVSGHAYDERHVCTICGHESDEKEHVWGSGGVCVVCGKGHSPHVWNDKHACAECGAYYGSAEHEFENGECVVCGLHAAWDGSVADGFSSGSGSAEDPYIIGSGAELAYLAALVNGGDDCAGESFRLACDIYLGGREWTPIGYGWYTSEGNNAEHAFAGSFDGSGHTVYGLNVNLVREIYDSMTRKSYACAGLFGAVCGRAAEIYDLAVADYVIDLTVSGDTELCAGGIVGYLSSAKLKGCFSEGVITAAGGSAAYVGGIVGRTEDSNYYGGITSCCAYLTADVSADTVYAGGICGRASYIRPEYCAAFLTADVSGGKAYAAGIAAQGESLEVLRCFAEADIVMAEGGKAYAVTDGKYSGCHVGTVTAGGVPLVSDAQDSDVAAFAETYGADGGIAEKDGRLVPIAFASDSSALRA